jgi:hypothetical protein
MLDFFSIIPEIAYIQQAFLKTMCFDIHYGFCITGPVAPPSPQGKMIANRGNETV